MSEKVAIVTGGGRGLGRAISARLAQDGFRVVVVYHSHAEDAASLIDSLTAQGHDALALQADVSDRAQVQAMATQALNAYGRIDVLVNNAGVAYRATAADVTEDEWDRVMNVNLKSALLCTQAALPSMKAQGGGRIVLITSVAADKGGIGPHYSASKAGMIGLMRFMAREFGPDHITVNAVSPANIPTDMLESLGMTPNVPRLVKRTGTPEDVAAAVSYLVSDEAGFVTAQIITVDGGRLLA